MKIASELTVEQWEKLVGTEKDITIDYRSNEKWDEAYIFFEQRINTRYLNPINAILNIKDNSGEGFAVVNLQCSLIETIESFINGCISEYNIITRKTEWKNEEIIIFNSNKEIFKSFFENRIPIKELNIGGGDFYNSVRCSLLHETQTKNNWKIKKAISHTESYEEKDGFKIIYRENFQEDLIKLLERYKDVIVNGGEFDGIPDYELRENFISKFNHICTKSL